MFNFIKSRFAKAQPVLTQRMIVDTLLQDLNEILLLQPHKAKVIVDPNTGAIDLELPAQMADELLALPSPDQADKDEA